MVDAPQHSRRAQPPHKHHRFKEAVEQSRARDVLTRMKIDHDVILLATRLVEELGESAIRISRVRLVELTAANNLRAAAFWRDVLRTSERLLAERTSRMPPPPAAGASVVAEGMRP